MKDYQREFIELSVQQDVLKFGEFVLKSGRKRCVHGKRLMAKGKNRATVDGLLPATAPISSTPACSTLESAFQSWVGSMLLRL